MQQLNIVVKSQGNFFLGEDEFLLWVFWSNLWEFSLYWSIGGLYSIMYITNKPAFLMKYKVQPSGNEDVSREKIFKVTSVNRQTNILNQLYFFLDDQNTTSEPLNSWCNLQDRLILLPWLSRFSKYQKTAYSPKITV